MDAELVIDVSENLDDCKRHAKVVLDAKLHLTRKNISGNVSFCNEIMQLKRAKTKTWVYKKVTHSRPYWITSIAYLNNEPVGMFLVTGRETSFYVKVQHRRKGIAKSMFRQVANKYDLSGKLCNYGTNYTAVALRKSLNLPDTCFHLTGCIQQLTPEI